MSGAITLRVITPDSIVVDTTCDSVKFPGFDGGMGVLPRHAAMVAALDDGELSWKGGEENGGTMFIAGGFAEVRNNTLRIVTQSGERASEIDVDRATEAAKRAQENLRAGSTLRESGEFDLMRAEHAMRRALMRQKISKRS
tara:strand:+ start:3083 stop:3505 length:423 start_codon:yes stop_codon:yes gene_type:complete